jgi:uncharacterized membrane protein YsdA (DUF1294 family)
VASKPRKSRAGRRRRRSPFLFFTLIGALLTATLTLVIREYTTLSLLLAYLAAVNLITFLLFAYDKVVAGFELLRIPERTLHFFELVGGTPAAFLAQEILRHKTSKMRYRIVFWILAVVQIAIVVWAVLRFHEEGGI